MKMTTEEIKIGTKITKSGYPGIITEILSDYSVVVRLASGESVVDINDLVITE